MKAKHIFLCGIAILVIGFLLCTSRYHAAQLENLRHLKDGFHCLDRSQKLEIIRRFYDGEISETEARGAIYDEDDCILICPFCFGDVVPISYGIGQGNYDCTDYDLSGRLRIHYGGCVMSRWNWACVKCDRHFRYEGFLLLDRRHERERKRRIRQNRNDQ